MPYLKRNRAKMPLLRPVSLDCRTGFRGKLKNPRAKEEPTVRRQKLGITTQRQESLIGYDFFAAVSRFPQAGQKLSSGSISSPQPGHSGSCSSSCFVNGDV